MKKAILVSCLLAFGCVWRAQAVVISWATDGVPSGTTSAQLVYVSSGNPVYTAGSLSNGEAVGGLVSGLAVTPAGVGEQSTTDGSTRIEGAYYVVLFDASGNYAYSLSGLAYNDTDAITYDEMAPATGTFLVDGDTGFSGWTPVPEPSTAMLLTFGAAVAALRRRKRA